MGWRVQVRLISIGTPGGSAREGVCITAGVAAVGGACERRRENGVHRGAKRVINTGVE
jgi:hypothetical protein